MTVLVNTINRLDRQCPAPPKYLIFHTFWPNITLFDTKTISLCRV